MILKGLKNDTPSNKFKVGLGSDSGASTSESLAKKKGHRLTAPASTSFKIK